MLKAHALAGVALSTAIVTTTWCALAPPPSPAAAHARGALPLSGPLDPRADGHLVAVTGPLRAAAPLGDPGLLRPGDFIELWRRVEIYSYREIAEADTGRLTHPLAWSEDPQPPWDMRAPQGHETLPPPLRSDLLSAPLAWVGAYRFRPPSAQIWAFVRLPLSPELLAHEDRRWIIAHDYLHLGGDPAHPRPGDVRVSYLAVRAGAQVTLFGRLHQGLVEAAWDERSSRLYHVLPGPYEAALRTLSLPAPQNQRPWAL